MLLAYAGYHAHAHVGMFFARRATRVSLTPPSKLVVEHIPLAQTLSFQDAYNRLDHWPRPT